MLSDNARLQLRQRPDLSIQTLQNDKAHTNNTAVCALWIMHIQDNFLVNWKFFLDPISPKFCQLGEVEWNWTNLVTSTDVALHSWTTAKLTAEWWGVQTYCTAPSRLNLQFITETPQVRTGVNTLVGTNQEVAGNASGLDPVSITRLQGSYLQFPSCIFRMYIHVYTSPYTLGRCLRKCLRMHTRNGKGAYARICRRGCLRWFKVQKSSLFVTEPPQTPRDATNSL